MWVVIVSDVITSETTEPVASRRLQRGERQARVGLLRNPNRPPRPPPRRAPLMGKWLDLRSSRRLSHEQARVEVLQLAVPVVDAEQPEKQVKDAIALDPNGQVSAINVDHLMDVARNHGVEKPVRTPYGAGYRPEMNQSAPTAPRPKRISALSAQAWEEDLEPEPEEPTATPVRITRQRRTPRLLRVAILIAGGVLMALTVLLILPDVTPIQHMADR